MVAFNLSITHAGTLASHGAHALSDAASDLEATNATTTVGRIIRDVASIIIIVSVLWRLRMAVCSFVNQVPEAVDTLLKIKEFLVEPQGDPSVHRYLEKYKRIQYEVQSLQVHAMFQEYACGLEGFSVGRVWSHFRKSRRANKEAHRLLEDIRLLATELYVLPDVTVPSEN